MTPLNFNSAAPLATVQSLGGRGWLPPEGSTTAAQVDWLFFVILGISGFFFIAIVATMIIFLIRYRERKGWSAEETPNHNLALELTWSIIPLILVLVIFWFGFKTYLDMFVEPEGAYEINVTAQKWSWMFTYPNGHVDEQLHVPAGQPVRLVITSLDVIHSLYVPAFRVKMDAVPGRYSSFWFEAPEPGNFPLYCAEYCGREHSAMTSVVVVHEAGTFKPWLEEAANLLNRMSPAEAGEILVQSRGCAQCHSSDGTSKIGPSFLELFGRTEATRSGETVVADENYIRESILEPGAMVVAGFDPVMPTYRGRLREDEIMAVIAFLKTLSETGRAQLTVEETSAPESEDDQEVDADADSVGSGGESDATETGESENMESSLPAGSGAPAPQPDSNQGETADTGSPGGLR